MKGPDLSPAGLNQSQSSAVSAWKPLSHLHRGRYRESQVAPSGLQGSMKLGRGQIHPSHTGISWSEQDSFHTRTLGLQKGLYCSPFL